MSSWCLSYVSQDRLLWRDLAHRELESEFIIIIFQYHYDHHHYNYGI